MQRAICSGFAPCRIRGQPAIGRQSPVREGIENLQRELRRNVALRFEPRHALFDPIELDGVPACLRLGRNIRSSAKAGAHDLRAAMC